MVLSPDSEFFRFFNDIQGREVAPSGKGLGEPAR